MNKIYRVIWNAATSNWVVVSEIAKTVAAKSRSVCVSRVRPYAAPAGSGYFTLTDLATAFCLAGLLLLSTPAMAVGKVGGVTVGDGPGVAFWPSHSGCKKAASAGDARSIAIGCGAIGAGGGTSILDRKNPYDQRDDVQPNRSTPTAHSVGVGDNASAGQSAVAIGGNANARGIVSVALGGWARSDGTSSVALGVRAYAKGDSSFAVGRQSVASGKFAQAIGNVSAAVGKGALAVGHSATAIGDRAIAIGSPDADSTAERDEHYHSKTRTLAEGVGSIALGTRATTKSAAINSLALGTGTQVTVDSGVAIGRDAKVTRANAVALGSASTTEQAATAVSQATVAGKTYSGFAGVSRGADLLVSVGAAGSERQLKNVAAGEISATSTDAINGSQLYSALNRPSGFKLQTNGDTATVVEPGGTVQFIDGTNIDVTRNGNNVTIATSPTLTANSLTINGGPVLNGTGLAMGNKKISGVANGTSPNDAVNFSQLGAVKTIADTAKTEAAKGWNLRANGDGASKVVPGATVEFVDGANIDVTRRGNTITIATSQTLTGNSLTINNGGPVLNGSGIAMGSKKLTGLANGSNPNDAVNFSQLGGVKTVADNAMTEVSKGWSLQTNGDTASKVAPGGTVQFIDGMNIDLTRSGSNITIATSPALTANSLTINNGGPVLNTRGIAMGNKKLTGLASGTDANDAVTVSQLNGVKSVADNARTEASKGLNLQVNGDATSKVGPGSIVRFLDGANVSITRSGNDITIATSSALTADRLTISNGGPVVSVDGIAMANKKIVGLADGTDAHDAVNVSQLGTVKTAVNNVLAEAAKGWNLQANGDTAGKIAPGDTVHFLDGTNINVTRNGNDITIATTSDLTADSLTINNDGPVLSSNGIDMSDKKLTNVAPGSLSADSKDAANAGQVFSIGDSMANALGGDSAFDPATGGVTASLKVGDGTFNNLNDALGDLNTKLTETTSEVNKGWNLQANGDTASKVAPGDTVQFLDGTNINVIRNSNDITIATTPALSADSLNINNGGPVLSSNGIDMNDKKLSNVAGGTLSADSKDAANAGQVFAVGKSMANALGGDSAFDPATGGVTASLKVGDGTFNNLNDALGDLNTKLAETTSEVSKGWNLQANGDTASKVAPGDTVQFLDGTNINVNRNGNDITIATTSDLTADSLTLNNGGPVLSSNGIDMSDKKLINVAPGTLSADSKDAANAGQVFAIGDSMANALGGDSAFDPATGAVTASLKVGDGTFTNLNDALGDLNTKLTETTSELNKGWNLQANGDTASKVTPGDTVQFLDGTNIDITRTGNDLTIATLADLMADSLTINNGGPVLSSNGIDMSNKKLTNVAPGSLSADSKDAANAGQVFAIGDSMANALGGDSAFDLATGTVTASLKVGDSTFSNLNDALGDLNTKLTETTSEVNKGWNLQANGDTASKVAPGDTVQFLDGTNIDITRTGNDLTIATSADLTADSLTMNNGGPVFSSNGIDMSGKKLTNVAPGVLSAESKEAANASQVFAIGDTMANALGGDSAFDPATGAVTASLKVGDGTFSNLNDALGDLNTKLTETTSEINKGWNLQANGDTASKVAPGDTVQFLDGTNIYVMRSGNDITIATTPDLTADSLSMNNGGPVLSSNGIDMSDKKLTNVAPGTLFADSKDAANAGQVFAIGNSTASALGGDSSFDPATGAVTAALKLDESNQTFNNLNDALNAVNDQASKGFNLQANGDTASKVAPGDTVQFLDGTNIDITHTGNDVTIATSADLTADSLAINNGGPVLSSNGIDMSDKKITNVTAGTLSADSREAANAGQVFAVGDSMANALGGDSTFDPATGVVTASLKVGEGTFTNLNDALGDLNTKLTDTTAEVNKGWNLQANGDTASKVAPGDTVQFLDGTNINVTRSGNDITVATTPDLTADSLTINNGGPALSSKGIDMGNKKLTNVAPGTLSADSKDAANAGQVFAVGDSMANALGGDSAFDPVTGAVTASLKVGDGTFNNLNDALGDLNTKLADTTSEVNKGWNLQANGDTASKVAPGDTVQFLDGTNINVTRSGNDITFATTPDLTADSLSMNNGGPVLSSNGIDMSDKKITNVEPGTLSADSKDAANAGQVFAIGDSMANALGGDSVFDPATGAITASLKVGEGTFSNLNDALGDLNTKLTETTSEVNKGWNLQANGDTASKVAPGDTVQFLDGTNINVTRNGNDIAIATTPDLAADSLTLNDGGPVLSSNGIDMSDKKLTNVAPGTLSADSKDAANAGQVFAIGDSTANALGGDSAFDPTTGAVTASLKVGDGTFSNLNDALGDLNTKLTDTTAEVNKGWNLQANGDTASKVAPGDTVQFLDGTNINVTRSGNDITIATTADLTADSLTLNNGGPVLSNSGIDMSDKKLSNVAAGTLSADSKDAANAGQVFAIGDSMANALGGDSAFDPATGAVTASLKVGEGTFNNLNDALGDLNTKLTDTTTEVNKGWNLQANGDTASKVAPGDTVQFLDGTNINVTRSGIDITIATTPDLTADSLTINNGGPALSSNGIDMGDKKLTNVAPGALSADSKDAANAGQVFAIGDSMANALGGDSAFDPATGTVTASLKVGDSAFSNLNDALGDLNTKLTETTSEVNKGWNLQANGDTASKVAPGDTVQFLDGTNINVMRSGNDITIATAPDLTSDSLTINNGGPVLSSNGIDMSDKKLTNVAPGTLSADSKDAANAGQVFAVGDSMANALGGDSAFDPATGAVTASLKVGEGTFSNLNDALGDLNTKLSETTAEANKGWNLQANGDTASKVAPGDTVQFLDGTNINVTRSGNDITIATSTELTADSLTINNGGPVLSSNGIDMSDKKLTNVALGTLSADSKDAANAGQVFAVGDSMANALGGDSAFDPATGAVTASLKVGEGTFNNLNDALGDLNTKLTDTAAEVNKGWNLQANGDTASKVVAGDTVQFLDGTNINVTRSGNDITIATTPDLTADSLAINNGGPVLSSNGIDMSDKKLTNVAPGILSADSKDAANAGQVFAIGDSMANALGGDSAFDPATGAVTASLKVGEGTFSNLNDALGDLNTKLSETTAEANKGWNLQANGDTASKVVPGDTVQFLDGTNIDITRAGNDITIATSTDLTADSLTLNNGGPVLSSNGIDMSDKKLTNVAPGTLSADSKDAAHAGQVFAIGDSMANALGGDSAFDPVTGAVTASLKVGDGTFNNLNDALGDLNTKLTETTSEVYKGWNLQANGDTASKVAPGDTVQFLDGTNINVTRSGNDVTIATTADLTADGLTLNNGGPVLSNSGIDMSDKKLSNVAAGTLSADSKDAANAGQVFAIGSSTANALGGDSSFDPATGAVTAALKLDQGGQTFDNLNDALNAVNGQASKGFNLQANGDTASKVAPGDTVQFLDGTNINVTRSGNDITIATPPDLTADSLTINNGGPVLSSNGIDMSDKKLTNVAPGTLSADSKDAANAGQVFAIGDSMANALGGDSAFDPATGAVTASLKVGAGTFTNLNDALGDLNTRLTDTTAEVNKGWNLQANGETASKVAPGDTVQFLDGTNINVTRSGNDITIATTADLTADSLAINNGGPVLSSNGIDMSDKKLTNVAPGNLSANSKDAANAGQVFAIGDSMANALGGDSAFDPATGAVNASLKVGEGTFTNLNDALGDLNTKLTDTAAEVNKGWNLQANGDTASKVIAGDTVQFLDGANIDITRTGSDITIATSADLTADSLTINNGGPVLSSNGIDMSDKKLTNVATGTLSADSKDAANAGQVFEIGDSMANALGGDSAFDPATGAVTASLKVGAGTFTNLNDALGDLNTRLTDTTAELNKGWNLQANGDTASKIAPGDTVQFLDGTNTNVTRSGNDITIATTPDLTADSLTINNGGPVLSRNGIDMGDKKLTNVAPGALSADSKDAANAGQVFAIGDSMANALGGDSAFDPTTGALTASLKVGEGTFNNLNDALGDLNTKLTDTTAEVNKGWNLQANGDTASKVAPGDTVQFLDGTNINVTRSGNDITIATTADLTADSLTLNDGGPVLSSNGIDMQGKKITNFAPGVLSADSQDGVSGSQLFAVGNSTASSLGGESAFDPDTGVVTASLKVGDNTFTNVNDALGDLHHTLAETTTEVGKGWNLQANGDTASKVAAGDTVEFLDGTNVNISRKGNALTIATAPDLTADSLIVNNGGPVLSSNGIDMSDKKLTNVASGTLSAGSKDAANAGQVFAIGDSMANALGGDSAFDPATGAITASLKVGEGTFSNLNDALGDLNTKLTETTSEVNKGWNLQANGDTASKVAPGDTVQFLDGTNINVTRNGNDITIATTPDLTADSLTINNGGPVLSSTGIDMGGKKLTNVGAGTLSADSKDGVNASQLFAVGNSTASALGGDSAFDPETGSVVAGLKIDDQTFTNVNDALNAVNANVGAIARRGWDIAGADGIVGTVGSGGQVQFVAGNAHTKVDVTQENGVAKVSVAAAASPLQYTETANANGKNAPVADPFGKTNSVTLVGQDAAAPVSLNNVAKGKLSEDSLQAVNGSQLHGLGQSIASTLGGDTRFNAETGKLETKIQVGDDSYNTIVDALNGVGATASQGWQLQVNNDDPQKVAPGSTVGFKQGSNIQLTRDGNSVTIATAANVTFDSVKTGKLEGDTISAKSYLGVIDGPALTQSGIDAAGKRISNVQAGEIAEGSTDAVTGGQMYNLASGTASAINNLQGNLDRVEKNANAGSATAGAMANLPQAYLPGKSMFALASARYGGQQGFAAGLSKVSENGNWIIKGSVSGNSRGKTMIGAGIGYQW